MTLEIGCRIRSLVDLITDDGSTIPIGSAGMVIGHQGQKVVVDFVGLSVTCNPWEVRRA